MEENIKNLNMFLSDLEVMTVKLQNYHWYVTGKGFFITHEKLEEYYEEMREQIDEIAEHILSKGYEPLATMKDFLENTEIQEAKNEKIKSLEIIKSIIKDLETLKNKAIEIKKEADNKSDYATSAMMDDYLKNYSKKLWMLNECLK